MTHFQTSHVLYLLLMRLNIRFYIKGWFPSLLSKMLVRYDFFCMTRCTGCLVIPNPQALTGGWLSDEG